MIGNPTCPICRATAPVDRARTAAGCSACADRRMPAMAAGVAAETAIETTIVPAEREPPPIAKRWLGLAGALNLLVVYAATLRGVPAAAVYALFAIASAVTIAIGVWHARRSGRPVLPGAIASPRRRRESPPPG